MYIEWGETESNGSDFSDENITNLAQAARNETENQGRMAERELVFNENVTNGLMEKEMG
jgi:hypothetical protein